MSKIKILFWSGLVLCLAGCREEQAIKVALLPILDSLPGYVAEANGYFLDEGIEVEILPVNSSLDRDQIMQSGEADCMLAELSTTAVFNAESNRLRTISTVREASSEIPLFRIIANTDSGIDSWNDLEGRSVSVGENSITEYIARRILQKKDFDDEAVRFDNVAVIPERFSLLMSGQIPAAILPDPLASTAMAAGHREILSDTIIPQLSMSVLTASVISLEQKDEEMEAFLRGWFTAVEEINSNPGKYLSFYIETLPSPEGLESYFTIPPFPAPRIPGEETWIDMINWLQMKGILDTEVDYRESVVPDYLPGT